MSAAPKGGTLPERDEAPIPRGWCRARLREIATKIVDGSHNPPAPAVSGRPMLSARNIENDHINWQEPYRVISDADFESENKRTNVSPGDVLLTIVGSIGRALAVPATAPSFSLQRSVAVISTTTLEPRFLAHQFHAPGFAAFLRAAARGTAQKGVYLGTLGDAPVLVAPGSEQLAVVGAVDSYVSRLDKAEAALGRVGRNLKRYRAAVLQTAVEGRLVQTEAELARAEGRDYERASELLKRILAERRRRWEQAELARLTAAGKPPKDDSWKATYEDPEAPPIGDLPELPEGWCWTTVGQVGEVSGGLTKNPKRDGLPVKLPYLRVANVYANELRLSDIESIGIAEAEVERTLLDRGDLLVVEGNGSVEQIGRVALWDGSIDPCVHQNHIIKVRFPTVSTSGWVLWSLLSPSGREL